MSHGTREWANYASKIPLNVETSEGKNIWEAAQIISESISKGHATFLFGSGHSAIPVEEMYPRYGGILGFIPILELPLTFFTQIVGNMGFPQFDYLENDYLYGRKILENYTIHKDDSLVVFSHSGSTPVTTELAMAFKEKMGKVICVTSKHRALNSKSKHPLGKTLLDISDVSIDTQVPDSDVSVQIGSSLVGPLSTIGAISVANFLSVETANNLKEKGCLFSVNPVRSVDPDSDKKMAKILTDYKNLYANHISSIIKEA